MEGGSSSSNIAFSFDESGGLSSSSLVVVSSDLDVDKKGDFGVGEFVEGSSSLKVTFSSEVY